jgi:hypothetical protein
MWVVMYDAHAELEVPCSSRKEWLALLIKLIAVCVRHSSHGKDAKHSQPKEQNDKDLE